MPIYRMVNPETSEPEDVMCSIADMEALKLEGWVTIISSPLVISGRDHSGQGGGHGTSDGWKDVLRNIKDKNPHSTIDV